MINSNTAATCPITQEVMEDPVVCADGHSYERSAITQWLLSRNTSPATNMPLPSKSLVPNHALRNLIAEARGVPRPTTLEEHMAVALPCRPEADGETHGADQATAAGAAAPADTGGAATDNDASDDDAPAPAPGHAGDTTRYLQPPPAPAAAVNAAAASAAAASSAAPAAGTAATAPPPSPAAAQPVDDAGTGGVGFGGGFGGGGGGRDGGAARARAAGRAAAGKNALHWAMVDGPTAEARQLRLLHAEPELAAQADQGGNLPLHYAASAGVKPAVAVACALAFPGALSWADKRGRAPLEIAELEGHRGVASVLSGLANRQRNELHDAFAAGAAEADEQLRLLRCRPELAAQRDGGGALPLHAAARAGASAAAADACARAHADGARARDDDGFYPHQLALEAGHRELAELLAAAAGLPLPAEPVNSVLAKAAAAGQTGGEWEEGSQES